MEPWLRDCVFEAVTRCWLAACRRGWTCPLGVVAIAASPVMVRAGERVAYILDAGEFLDVGAGVTGSTEFGCASEDLDSRYGRETQCDGA